MPNILYVLLDERYTLHRSDILSTYYTDRRQALQRAKSEITTAAELTYKSDYPDYIIKPVKYHYQQTDNRPVTEIVGWSVCKADGTPLDSITINVVSPVHWYYFYTTPPLRRCFSFGFIFILIQPSIHYFGFLAGHH